MTIKGEAVVCQIDSGAGVNVIPLRHIKHSVLEQSKTKLHIYNGIVIRPRGKLGSC